MLPAGKEWGAKVAFRPTAGREDAEAVRADEARAVGAHQREQLLLAADALDPGLGEPGRDHAEGARPLPQRRLCLGEHGGAGNAEDRQVDVAGDVRDRRVGLHAGDGAGLRVDRVGDPGEVGVEDVAEELPADRAASRRSADHGDRSRGEEGCERRRDGDVVALVDGGSVGLRRLDCEANLGRAALEPPRDREPRVREDAQHRAVVRHHLGDELGDPGVRGRFGELLEQARADSAPLQLVRDRERDLGGRRVAQPDEARERDDALASAVARQRPDQRAALLPVGVEEGLDGRGRERGKAVEAPVDALLARARRRTRAPRPGRPHAAGAGVACSRPEG